MNPARIAELLAPFLQAPPGPPAFLTDAQLGQVSAYLDLLLRWNARINLTAVRDAESMVTRHFGARLQGQGACGQVLKLLQSAHFYGQSPPGVSHDYPPSVRQRICCRSS